MTMLTRRMEQDDGGVNERDPGTFSMRSLAAPRAGLCRRSHPAWSGPVRVCFRCRRSTPWLLLPLLALSSITSVFKVNLPLARSGSTMSVSYAVDFASLLLLGAERDDARGGGERVQPVHVPHQGTEPLYRTLFSMACLVADRAGGRRGYQLLGGVPGHARSTLPEAARRRGDDLLRHQHADDRHGDRALDAAVDLRRSGTRTSCGARRATSSAPAPRPLPPGSSSSSSGTGSRRSRRRRST